MKKRSDPSPTLPPSPKFELPDFLREPPTLPPSFTLPVVMVGQPLPGSLPPLYPGPPALREHFRIVQHGSGVRVERITLEGDWIPASPAIPTEDEAKAMLEASFRFDAVHITSGVETPLPQWRPEWGPPPFTASPPSPPPFTAPPPSITFPIALSFTIEPIEGSDLVTFGFKERHKDDPLSAIRKKNTFAALSRILPDAKLLDLGPHEIGLSVVCTRAQASDMIISEMFPSSTMGGLSVTKLMRIATDGLDKVTIKDLWAGLVMRFMADKSVKPLRMGHEKPAAGNPSTRKPRKRGIAK